MAEIFISYAWKGESEKFVDELYAQLIDKSYHVILDRADIGYKQALNGFMNRLGAGKAVFVILSKKYLESKNCMYEALQIRSHGDVAKRIFPVVLGDADIYDAIERLKVRSYWEDRIAGLNKAITDTRDKAYLTSIYKELDLLSDIKRFIDEFMGIVADMNCLTPEMHRRSGFKEIMDALDKLFLQDGTMPTYGIKRDGEN